MNPKEIEQEVLKRLPHPAFLPKTANVDKLIEYFRNEVIEEEAIRRVVVLLPKESMTVDEEELEASFQLFKKIILEENKNESK